MLDLWIYCVTVTNICRIQNRIENSELASGALCLTCQIATFPLTILTALLRISKELRDNSFNTKVNNIKVSKAIEKVSTRVASVNKFYPSNKKQREVQYKFRLLPFFLPSFPHFDGNHHPHNPCLHPLTNDFRKPNAPNNINYETTTFSSLHSSL